MKPGDRVTTPAGPGTLVAFDVRTSWTMNRPNRHAFAIVELDDGVRWTYSATRISAAVPVFQPQTEEGTKDGY